MDPREIFTLKGLDNASYPARGIIVMVTPLRRCSTGTALVSTWRR